MLFNDVLFQATGRVIILAISGLSLAGASDSEYVSHCQPWQSIF
jgi:hypothetical protein